MDQLLHIFNPWWEGQFVAEGIERTGYLEALTRKRTSKDVVFITGLRRVGKTTLVRQLIGRLLAEGEDPRRIVYFTMDHPALVKESILTVLDAYRRVHELRHDDRFTAFIDEVHARDGFEQELKAVHDMGHVKVYATGSSSLFLVERGSFLTGRQSFVEVYPFTFKEYLGMKGTTVRPSDSHLMVRYAEDYVLAGGLPEYLRTSDPGYVTTLVDSLLFKDIAARRGVRNLQALRELLLLVTQSTGSKVSPRKIARTLGISHETVREHLSFFEEANLIHMVRLRGKVSESVAAPKKVYVSDTGIVRVMSPTVNIGSLVENCVFNALRARGRDITYGVVDGKEVDFIMPGECIEVKYTDRVGPGDVSHLMHLKVGRRTVVTRNQSGRLEGVNLVPLWRFLMQEKT